MQSDSGRNQALFNRTLFVVSQYGPDEGHNRALAANLEFGEPLSIDEAEKTIASAIECEVHGQNYYSNPALSIPFNEVEKLRPHPLAFSLWSLILQNHFNRTDFALSSDAMARDGVIPGWSRKQYRNATETLLKLEFIVLIHQGTGRGNPNKYAVRHKWP